MVKIRLTRGGAKKRPFYHIIVTDSRSARDGRNIERLGFYNPVAQGQEKRVELNVEAIKAWVAKGAQPTDRVLRFLDAAIAHRRQAAIGFAQAAKAAWVRGEQRLEHLGCLVGGAIIDDQQLGLLRIELPFSFGRDRVLLASVTVGCGGDEAEVFEHGECRVDGAGAG